MSTPIHDREVDPTPVERAPVDQTPVDRTPVEPTVVEPTVVEPVVVEPTRVDQTRVDATPVEGAPLATAPATTERERATYGERTTGTPEEVVVEDRESVYSRERAEFGGIKFGVAFFGWLTATGLLAMLSAIAAAIFATFGFDADTVVEADFAAALTSAIVLLAILFVSYLAGGYVAGRMARFAGAKQGVAVWIWGMVVTGVLIAVAAIAGSQLDVLSNAGVIPQIAFGPDQVLATVLTIAGVIVVSLLGAVLGGIAGMRFHRRVDRAGWAR